jgi:outer membrane protein assembly factor BamE (lipoprotein component of BamABCDE complex)
MRTVFKHISNILLLFIIIFLTNCQRNQVLKSHGISFLDKRQESLVVNKMNKNDVQLLLGAPSTVGVFDDTVWIYIERTKTRGKLLNFGKNITLKNNVLVLKFSNRGLLYEKKFYDKKSIKKINFSKEEEEGLSKETSFITSFLASVRQKIYKQK